MSSSKDVQFTRTVDLICMDKKEMHSLFSELDSKEKLFWLTEKKKGIRKYRESISKYSYRRSGIITIYTDDKVYVEKLDVNLIDYIEKVRCPSNSKEIISTDELNLFVNDALSKVDQAIQNINGEIQRNEYGAKENDYYLLSTIKTEKDIRSLYTGMKEFLLIDSEIQEKDFLSHFCFNNNISLISNLPPKMIWKKSNYLLVYFFEVAVHKKFIIYELFDYRHKVVSDHFLNKKGLDLNNKRLANTAQGYSKNPHKKHITNKKPKNAELIDKLFHLIV